LRQVSYNCHVAKVVALFAVIAAHYAQVLGHPFEQFLWIPAEIGLAVFAFFSGYFTAKKYGDGFSIAGFWKAKVFRLLGPLLVIDAFLVCLFLFQGKEDVFCRHSVLAWFGLTGVLRLFGVPRGTPFGNGLWFLTLLLLFYAAYPVLQRVNRSKVRGVAILVAGFVLALVLRRIAPLGVSFWETAWFFLLGAYCGRHLLTFSVVPSLMMIGVFGALVPVVRFGFDVSWMSPIFVMGLSMGTVLFATGARFPTWGATLVGALSGAMLQMYVIHTYVFVIGFSGSPAVDFCISLLLVVCLGFALQATTRFIGKAFRSSI